MQTVTAGGPGDYVRFRNLAQRDAPPLACSPPCTSTFRATVKTLLGRLMRKGLIRSERDDGRQIYRPLLDRDAYAEGEVQALLDRLYGGDPVPWTFVLAERP